MGRSFSFTGESVLSILRSLTMLLPGIEKVVGIWFSPEKSDLQAAAMILVDNQYLRQSIDLSPSRVSLQKLRLDSAPHSWLRADSLPFELRSKENIQLDIYNELDNSVLLVRIKNESDGGNDLFFLYFAPGMVNFGSVEIDKVLSTENKTVIAYLVRNSILDRSRMIAEDRETWLGLNENSRALLTEMNATRLELSKSREQFKDMIISLCNSYLSVISARTGRRYRLDDDACTKLRSYTGDSTGLDLLMEKAAANAEVFNPNHKFDEVMISEYHIHFDKKPEKRQVETLPEAPGELPVKYTKTHQLLDKLENAARVVKSQNKLLTSSNLGQAFPTPITPPAITDALKKHRTKILVLFREYPQRWEIIRNEFRPVQNILNPRVDDSRLSA